MNRAASIIRLMSRRQFLRDTGIVGGGLILAANSSAYAAAIGRSEKGFSPNVYVSIHESGDVEIVCHRSEMGQGIRTCLMQILADEMEAEWNRVALLQATGDPKYGDQNTDGSTSIRNHFDMLRTAGATTREMLIAAAGAAWAVPPAECTARAHAVHHSASGRSLGYGALAARAADVEVPEEVAFKSREEYRYIGKPIGLVDAFAMTTGTAQFGIDTAFPDMLHASIERCPVLGGSVASLDDSAARAAPGVVDVISMGDATSPPEFNPLGGVAVVAKNTWSAQQGRAALKIEWRFGANAGYDSDDYRRQLENAATTDGTVIVDRGAS